MRVRVRGGLARVGFLGGLLLGTMGLFAAYFFVFGFMIMLYGFELIFMDILGLLINKEFKNNASRNYSSI